MLRSQRRRVQRRWQGGIGDSIQHRHPCSKGAERKDAELDEKREDEPRDHVTLAHDCFLDA